MTTMNVPQLVKKLLETQGPLTVNDGVLWFESGESVDLSKVAATTEVQPAAAQIEAKNGQPRKPEGWTRDVFVKAFGTGEFGEAPCFAKITVDVPFIERLERLSRLCEAERLSEVRVTDGPTTWGGCDEDALRLQCPELVVSFRSFWFNDRPKHVDYDIQTRAQTIDEFVASVLDGEGPLFIDGVEEDIAALDADGILDDDVGFHQEAGTSLTNTCAEIPLRSQEG